MGTCLELDPSTLMIQMPKTKKVSLGFTFGVNISGNLSLLMSTDCDLIKNISVNAIIRYIYTNIKKSKTNPLHLSKLSLSRLSIQSNPFDCMLFREIKAD